MVYKKSALSYAATIMNADILRGQNLWWRDRSLPERFRSTVPRVLVPGLVRSLDPGVVLTLLGPRRVGKTVMLHQVVGTLLSQGVSPTRIVYFSADDILLGERRTLIPDILDHHRRTVATGDIGDCPTYVLIDEVHAVPDWPMMLKRYVDQAEPYVWLVTSSAGSLLHRGSTESLAGRATVRRAYPFSLSEVAALRHSDTADWLRQVDRGWEAVGFGPVTAERADRMARLERDPFRPSTADLVALTREYLGSGGFPEYVLLDDPTDKARYFPERLIERVLLLDVPALADIRNPALMGTLLRHLLALGPALLNVSDLARDLEASRLTVLEYLRVLQETMLDYTLDRYGGSWVGRSKGAKKSVPIDPGLTVSLGGWSIQGPNAADLEGRLAECVVHAWLRRVGPGRQITHWRERDKEVDFVVASPSWTVPVEVKWRPGGKTRRSSGIDEFERAFPTCDRPLVVTRDVFDLEGHVARLPLWMLA
jgi:predicted AAA+ superfamily ATPase